jgi:hypothetical protein
MSVQGECRGRMLAPKPNLSLDSPSDSTLCGAAIGSEVNRLSGPKIHPFVVLDNDSGAGTSRVTNAVESVPQARREIYAAEVEVRVGKDGWGRGVA